MAEIITNILLGVVCVDALIVASDLMGNQLEVFKWDINAILRDRKIILERKP